MSVSVLTGVVSTIEPLLCLSALVLLGLRGVLRQYPFLGAYLGLRLLSFGLLLPVLHEPWFHLSRTTAYQYYFYVYWTSYACETILGMGIIVNVFKRAMAPLRGLHDLGMMMFRWAGTISAAVAIAISFGPHVSSQSFILRAVMQMQRTQSVLTLCMLLFVCLAIRPMGLSYRSRIFGVSLGLGVQATADLVQAAWIPQSPTLFSTISTINGFAITLSLAIWIGYLVAPEPKRRMILLPTTSPFFRWNQISEALGDAPGFVALGQFTSDMFAPAEIEVMRRASRKMG